MDGKGPQRPNPHNLVLFAIDSRGGGVTGDPTRLQHHGHSDGPSYPEPVKGQSLKS